MDELDQALATFIARLDGGPVAVEAFCASYPESLRSTLNRRCQHVVRLRTLGGVSETTVLGRTFGEFTVLDEIGRGGMGVVYRAEQASLKREVALKVLPSPLSGSAERLQRFRTEAQATARIDDPRIVKIHSVGEQDGIAYIAMEKVDGRGLADEITALRAAAPAALPAPNTTSAVRQLAAFVAEIAEALHAAHREGVVHRDVQPRNILVQPDGSPVLIDFGLARIMTDPGVTRTGDTLGTPYYMSPEQVSSRPGTVDHRTDVFSLGAVLYELLCLRRPFEGSTSQEVFGKITAGEFESLRLACPVASRDLVVVCEKALAPAPADRFATAAEFAAELRRVASDEPILSRGPSIARRARRWSRKHRMSLGGAAVVAVTASAWWAGVVLADDSRLATVAVLPGHLDGAELSYCPIEPLAWVVGERVVVGACPTSVRLPVGAYRFYVDRGELGFAELTRDVWEEGGALELDARIVPTAIATAGMVRVAAGEFVFGTDVQPIPTGQSIVRRFLPTFWIDETEVTNASYRRFWLATSGGSSNVQRPSLWPEPYDEQLDSMPVTGVSLADATAYAVWSGKRLCTNPEWEKGARGSDGWLVPWQPGYDADPAQHAVVAKKFAGGDWSARLANYLANVESTRSREEGRSPLGLFHMLGNVAEFVETPALMEREDGRLVVDHGNLIARGNAYDVRASDARLSHQVRVANDVKSQVFGFRCAKSEFPPAIDR